MPCTVVHGNFLLEKEKAAVLQDRLSAILDKVLHKPKTYIFLILDEPKDIRFGGSDDPAHFY